MVTKNVGDLYTIQGAAEKLGVSFWTLDGYVRKHNVPTIKLGRTRMVRLSDLNGLK